MSSSTIALVKNLATYVTYLALISISLFFQNCTKKASESPSVVNEKLSILSPHRKSIQEEFVPRFEEYYEKTFGSRVKIEWYDQGGTSDDVRFLQSKFAQNKDSSGIDIFWGGGSTNFIKLATDGFLQSYTPTDISDKNIPYELHGIPLRDKNNLWQGTALTSFGIFFNKPLLAKAKLEEPRFWADLAKPEYFEKLAATDPRHSGSAAVMIQIVLASLGWEKGWEVLTAAAANTRKFSHSSSDPIKYVVTGDSLLSMAIDFYALAKVNELGKDKVDFVLPEGQTILDTDPIALLKGSPNPVPAKRFIDFVLKPEAQNLWMLPVGVANGPKHNFLGRMGINQESYVQTEGKRVYATNPYTIKSFVPVDEEQLSLLRQPICELYGAILVDPHRELKQAWTQVMKSKNKDSFLKRLSHVPVTEEEFTKIAKDWGDEKKRNQWKNAWIEHAHTRYKELLTLATK